MPVERRIREGAERNAEVIDPDVDRVLDAVIRRTRRRMVVRRSLATVVAVPTVVLALILAPHLLETVRGSTRPASQPTTAPPPTQGPTTTYLSGTFTRSLSGSLAVVRANGVAGTWTITTDAHGRLQLLAPPSFAGHQATRLFVQDANHMRTDAFGGGICKGVRGGTYSWARAGSVLMFTVVQDPCDARAAIISAAPWRLSS
jgi:hypothetical protein